VIKSASALLGMREMPAAELYRLHGARFVSTGLAQPPAKYSSRRSQNKVDTKFDLRPISDNAL
jgi:hypothetical protein